MKYHVPALWWRNLYRNRNWNFWPLVKLKTQVWETSVWYNTYNMTIMWQLEDCFWLTERRDAECRSQCLHQLLWDSAAVCPGLHLQAAGKGQAHSWFFLEACLCLLFSFSLVNSCILFGLSQSSAPWKGALCGEAQTLLELYATQNDLSPFLQDLA